MTDRSVGGFVLGAAALVAIFFSPAVSVQAAGAQSHAVGAKAAARALEPGYTGQLLYRNDNFRTGQNLAESILTPAAVNDTVFGLLFTDTIDGFAYAQPLYVPAVNIAGQGTHNVVYVATENDSVYAFDADAAGPPLWQTSFIDPANGITAVPATDLGCSDLVPIIGITATPVIDGNSGTLYVVSKVKLGPGKYQQQLHALDITNGSERMPQSPVTITASAAGTAPDAVNGIISFDPLLEHDRPALTLANGVVYLSFASHCDEGPFHGWILGYDENTLAQEVVYNTTPNGSDGGFWESGCGPGVDTNGDLISITGNGTFDTVTSPTDFGDSFMRLTPVLGTPGSMTVDSWFTPLNELTLDDEDADMGSGGNLLLPDQPGPNPHLVLGIGKMGIMYLVNRDAMGGFNPSMDQDVQGLAGKVNGMFSTPAYWQGTVPGVGLQNMIYTIGAGDAPEIWALSNGMIQTPAASVAQGVSFGFPGASPVISANGTTGGIMWAINSSAYKTPGPAILYAYDATNLRNQLYNSSQVSSDNPGPAVKFTVPTVANGSVYVGTQTQLAAFGPIPLRSTPTPTATATATASATPTATTTATPTHTATATATATPTLTATATATATATSTATRTATATATPTATATATPTPIPTGSPSPVAVTLAVKPKSVSFATALLGHQSKVEKIKVTNTSKQVPVTLSPPRASSEFMVTANSCPAVLQPGASCTIEVAFLPAVKGMENGTLVIGSNAIPGAPTVKFKGKGKAPKSKIKAAPKSLEFGQISTNTASTEQSISVVNLGAATISFSAAPAATPPFNVTANTCTTLAPNGASCTVSVEFAPHQHGKYQGTLELRDDAVNSPQRIKLSGVSK